MGRMFRRPEGKEDVIYGSNSESFTAVIHYGGTFKMDKGFRYTSEHAAYYDFCDKDTLCIFDFCDIALDLGMAGPLEKEDIFSNEEDAAEDEFETGDAVDFFQKEDVGEDEFETGNAAEFFENEDAADFFETEDVAADFFETEVEDVAHEVQTEDAIEVEDVEAEVETENTAHGVQSEDAANVVEEETENATHRVQNEDAANVVEEEDEVAFDVEVEVEVENGNEVEVEDFDSDFFDSDGEIAKDEVYEDEVAKRVAQDLKGLNENMVDEVDDTDSDSLHSAHGSDSDSPIWTEFNTECDMENPKFKIKTFNDVHTCSKVMKNKNITSKFLAKTYLHRWQRDRNYSDKLLRQEAEEDFVATIPPSKCLRARRYAMEILDGSYKEQFSKMYDYLGELRETNPGTRTICKLDARLFQRVYACLDACKKGYTAGCRPILSLDGCFLKGHYTGYILTAVGIDANDGIYPIAYAAVEGENFSSWSWFLLLLQTDLEISNSYHISFMSDRQKGLKEALEEVFHESKQRKCVRHIYNNFKSKEYNKEKILKDVVWKAARATYVTQYNKVMAEMQALSEASYKWFEDLPLTMWSKSHFSTRSKCDMLLNNLSECFNKVILEARDKPIPTMLEIIRTKMMKRIVQRREEAEKFTGPLCPKIQRKLDNQIQQSIRCYPTYADNFKYQVECGPGEQHVVDIKNHSCTCRKWDFSGIPCNHAVLVINHDNGNITSFVNPCYYKDTQLAIYGHYISPISGVNQWTKNQAMEPILPPVLRRPPGRPNKKRRLEADEAPTTGKVSKRGVKMTCTKCGKTGHNIRTCKGVVGGNKYLNKDRQGSRQQQPSRPKQPIRRKHNPPQQSSAQQQSSSQNQPPSVITVWWMMYNSATQESGVSNRATQDPNSVATD
ncbi:hypothetical protein V6N13_093417 [Hibiscus sabdariffa]